MFDKMSLWFYLLQGRVNTSDVFGVTNSDLVPGKYEGEEKLLFWCLISSLGTVGLHNLVDVKC